jgi:hypothetical protein
MRSRAFARALLVLAAVGASACSKTEDTAPERRVFGEPPRVETFEAVATTRDVVTCDIGESIRLQLCAFGIIIDRPEIEISGPYTSLVLQARVVDPDSTAERTDLLLVAASYATPSNEEHTLVMFDDGGATQFLIASKDTNDLSGGGGKACTQNPDTQVCTCQRQDFAVNSNDPTALDSVFTRAIGIVDSGTPGVLNDCIAEKTERLPVILDAGTTYSFRLDAIDRRGNLDTFPERHSITTGNFNDEPSRVTCSGDECGCCLVTSQNRPECNGKPGLTGPPGSGYEDGVCRTLTF